MWRLRRNGHVGQILGPRDLSRTCWRLLGDFERDGVVVGARRQQQRSALGLVRIGVGPITIGRSRVRTGDASARSQTAGEVPVRSGALSTAGSSSVTSAVGGGASQIIRAEILCRVDIGPPAEVLAPNSGVRDNRSRPRQDTTTVGDTAWPPPVDLLALAYSIANDR
jgi:hypothetical protein